MRSSLVFLALVLVMSSPLHAQTPPEEELAIRVTPDERSARRGEVVSFMVEVVNTSAVDVLRTGSSGGVALQMQLPGGFGFVNGSGLITLGSGQTVPALDPAASRAEPRLVQDRDGDPQTLNLGAGQALRFRYQIRALPQAKPNEKGTHRAWLVTANGTRLSADVVARVRIEADPEIDLAVVLGTVFCDGDGDGRFDAGERGLGGVRIAADHGRVVDTDREGRFHLRDFRPGAHLIKLDTNTLPPGTTLTTAQLRRFDLTGGLVVKHDFGVRCTENRQRPDRLTLAGADGPMAPAGSGDGLTVVGNARDLSIAFEGFAGGARRVNLTVEASLMTASGKRKRVHALNLPWRPGRLTRSLTFYPTIEGEGLDPERADWTVEVTFVDGAYRELLRTFHGRGRLPERLTWDGLDADGAAGVLKRGGLHEVRLVVTDGFGERLESAPVMIGASWSPEGPKKVLSRTIIRKNLLNKRQEPTPKLIRALKIAKAKLAKTPGARLLVEVHQSPSGVDQSDLIRTRRGAFNIATYGRRNLGLGRTDLFTMGFGATRPLRPNVTARNRAFNERIELVILPPEDPNKLATPSRPTLSARAFVQGNPVAIDDGGAFLGAATHEAGQRKVAVSVQAPDGARRTVVRGLMEIPEKEQRAPEDDPIDDDGALLTEPLFKPPASETEPTADEPPPKKDDAGVPEAPVATDVDTDPLRRFGGEPLREALGPGALVVGDDVGPNKVTADDFVIDLPPEGATLKSPRLFVSGQSDPNNAITVNGQPLHVGEGGRFGELVMLGSDVKSLAIVSTDKAGNVARLDWPITVQDTELFLLALVDGVGGQVGARLQERDVYAETANDSLFLAGRGALYVKGRISGSDIVKDLFVTAHVDTAKDNAFEPFFDQVIDPTRDYLIYGDSTDDLRDANARGPFYLLVEADRSKLTYGSFRTDIRGLHLLRYDRTFEGGKLDLDHTFAEGYRTRVKAYVSDDNRRLVRRHDELRATGGSVYYTSSKEIVEGSDKVELVVREQDTLIELGRATLVRDVHYRIDYPSGRVMTMGPISSVIDPFFQIAGFQPFTGRAILDGHEVWLDIDYESRAVQSAGDIAWGVQAKQQLFDRLEVGAGLVREGRPAGGSGSDDAYVLWGLHAKVELSEKSHVYAEYADAAHKDGGSRVSLDGGIGYRDLDRTPDDEGYAFLLGLNADIGELFEVEGLDLAIKAHWQLIENGYHATGLASEEGTEKWGGQIEWSPTEDGRVHLRYDGGTTLIRDDSLSTGVRSLVRNRYLARYDHRLTGGTVYGEIGHGQHRDDLDGKVEDTTAVAAGTVYRLLPRVSLLASQEILFGGDDDVLGSGTYDRLTTNLGVEVELTDEVSLRIGESLRWNGDNATRMGFSRRMGDGARTYFEQRIQPGDRNGRVVGATVIGAEHAIGDSLRDGRIYSEYRLDGGVGGRTNHAIMGLGRSFELLDDVKLVLAYERSQVLDAPERDPSRGSRDVLSGGLFFSNLDWLRLSSVYELRWDRDLPTGNYREVLQALTRNAVDVHFGQVTLLGLFNYILSQDLETRRVAREDMEASFGLALRPFDNDDLIIIGRYSRLIDRQSNTVVSLLGEALTLDERRISDLISLTGVIDLPWGIEVTEKLVWRVHSVDTTGSPLGDDDLLLWLTRLSVDIYGGLSVAGELRVIASLEDGEVRKNGGLIELAYALFGYGRVGLGWMIDGNAGGLIPGEEGNDIDNGFYLRLTGMY